IFKRGNDAFLFIDGYVLSLPVSFLFTPYFKSSRETNGKSNDDRNVFSRSVVKTISRRRDRCLYGIFHSRYRNLYKRRTVLFRKVSKRIERNLSLFEKRNGTHRI